MAASNSRARCSTVRLACDGVLFQAGLAGLLDAPNLGQVFGAETDLARHGAEFAHQQAQLRLLDGELVQGPLPVPRDRRQRGPFGRLSPFRGLDPPGGGASLGVLAARTASSARRNAPPASLAASPRRTSSRSVTAFAASIEAIFVRRASASRAQSSTTRIEYGGLPPGPVHALSRPAQRRVRHALTRCRGSPGAGPRCNGPLPQLAHRVRHLVRGDPGGTAACAGL